MPDSLLLQARVTQSAAVSGLINQQWSTTFSLYSNHERQTRGVTEACLAVQLLTHIQRDTCFGNRKK